MGHVASARAEVENTDAARAARPISDRMLGCSGSQPRTALVLSREAGQLPATHLAKPSKYVSASPGIRDFEGTPICRPIASAMDLNGTNLLQLTDEPRHVPGRRRFVRRRRQKPALIHIPGAKTP